MIESQRYNLKFQEKIMIHEREKVQNSMEIVMLEQLVPQDHILRKIDKYIYF